MLHFVILPSSPLTLYSYLQALQALPANFDDYSPYLETKLLKIASFITPNPPTPSTIIILLPPHLITSIMSSSKPRFSLATRLMSPPLVATSLATSSPRLRRSFT